MIIIARKHQCDEFDMIRKLFTLLILAVAMSLTAQSQGNYAVIVGSHAKMSTAKSQTERLSGFGLTGEIMEMETEIGIRYRVSESRHVTWKDAKERRLVLMDKLDRNDIWILKLTGDKGYKMYEGSSTADDKSAETEKISGKSTGKSSYFNVTQLYFPIFIASTAQLEAAESVAGIAKEKGYSPSIFHMPTRIGKRYRVAAEVYNTYAEAKSKLGKVRADLGISDAWLYELEGDELNKSAIGEPAKPVASKKFTLKPDEAVKKHTEKKKDVVKKDKIKDEQSSKKRVPIEQPIEVAKKETKQEIKKEDKKQATQKTIKEEAKKVDKKDLTKQEEIEVNKIETKAPEKTETKITEKPIDKIEEKAEKSTAVETGEDLAAKKDTRKRTQEPQKAKETVPRSTMKIDWDEFSRDYIDLVYAMVNKDYKKVQQHVDVNGFFAIRTTSDGRNITENYKEYENFVNFLSLYNASLQETEFIFNLQKYALAYQRMGDLPKFLCNAGKYDKKSIYKSLVNPYELKYDEYIMQSDNSLSEYDIKMALQNVNIGVVRGEWLILRGLYFAYDNDKLYLKFIDFSNPCK